MLSILYGNMGKGKRFFVLCGLVLACLGVSGSGTAAETSRNAGEEMDGTMTIGAATYFKLRDTAFAVGKTELMLFYVDEAQAKEWGNVQEPGLYLQALVGTVPQEDLFEGMAPSLYHNLGIQLDIRDWKNLEGKEWVFPYDKEKYKADKETEAGLFYGFQYTMIKSARFRVLKREGAKFRMRWQGIADVHWEEGGDFDTDVPFDCVFEAELLGIYIPQYVADASEQGLRKTLGNIFNLDDFKWTTTHRLDGLYFELENVK